MRQPREEEAPAETRGRGAPLSEGLPLQGHTRTRRGQGIEKHLSHTQAPGRGDRDRRKEKPAPAVAAPRLPSEADRKPGRQAASQASSLRPAGRAAPPRGSRSQAGGPRDRGAHPAAREHPSERPSSSGLRPRGGDRAAPTPGRNLKGAPPGRGASHSPWGAERERGGAGLGSPHGGAAGPPCAGTWTP